MIAGHPEKQTDAGRAPSETDGVMLCPQCDLMVTLPDVAEGDKAVCPRCYTTLSTRWVEPCLQPVCYAVSALVMMVFANLFPFINMRVSGIYNQIRLIEIPQAMMNDDYSSLAYLFLIFVQLIPAFCMVAIILLCLNVPLPYRLKVIMGRVIYLAKAWCMVEIFLVGVLVSFVKLMAYGNIGIGLSFVPYCLFCLLQVRAFQCTDRYLFWQNIRPAPALTKTPKPGVSGKDQGLRLCPCCTAILPADLKECPRCHTVGYVRKPNSLQWTIALLVTSIMLYIPANILPIMVTEVLGNPMASNIMSGVILLWEDGSYPVSLVIFIASIMVPTLKILAILWLCYDASGKGAIKGRQDRERMHVIYEIVEFVGRWSMIDVFVIGVLSALVRMGRLMSIYPDIGALLFAVVVILTMIAAMMFDPRLLWDRKQTITNKEPDSAE
ncbi:membrane integrity-associated transporter subunit PqiA [Budvicia diplopodorum]|uniref:membrane integrity-associated transporter subunit PqiA n=1 Tax=Budvicia diplopodorum TaxID=1119056 RepID=UPI0014783880|nr:membrane integrity-associated transporter subunit PqiA [Budvicia diplopodorum]